MTSSGTEFERFSSLNERLIDAGLMSEDTLEGATFE